MTASSFRRAALAVPAPRLPLSMLSAEQVAQLLWVIRAADSVKLKLRVSDLGRQSAATVLGLEPVKAHAQHATFFDTPDLTLYRRGLVVCIRQPLDDPAELTVKLRPVTPDRLPTALRRSPNFAVEVDAMPGGFVCSASVMAVVGADEAAEVLTRCRPLQTLLTDEQREFLAVDAPDGFCLNRLAMLGPITLRKLRFHASVLHYQLTAELWNYPDGPRILELSTKCDAAEAFDVATEAKTYLSARGVELFAEHDAMMRTALERFSGRVQLTR